MNGRRLSLRLACLLGMIVPTVTATNQTGDPAENLTDTTYENAVATAAVPSSYQQAATLFQAIGASTASSWAVSSCSRYSLPGSPATGGKTGSGPCIFDPLCGTRVIDRPPVAVDLRLIGISKTFRYSTGVCLYGS